MEPQAKIDMTNWEIGGGSTGMKNMILTIPLHLQRVMHQFLMFYSGN
jgi:hypothetical protein